MSEVVARASDARSNCGRALIERARRGDRDAYARGGDAVEPPPVRGGAAHPARPGRRERCAPGRARPDLARPSQPPRPRLYDAWSYRVMLRACSDARRRARRSVPSIDFAGDRGLRSPTASHMVALRDELERAFAALRIDQRAVLVLLYYEGLSVVEIADALGISVGTVKSRLHGARQAMRAAIDADARLPIHDGASRMTTDLELDRVLGGVAGRRRRAGAGRRRGGRAPSGRRARVSGGASAPGGVPSRGSRRNAGGRRRPSSWSPSSRRRHSSEAGPRCRRRGRSTRACSRRRSRIRAQMTSRSAPTCPRTRRRRSGGAPPRSTVSDWTAGRSRTSRRSRCRRAGRCRRRARRCRRPT